MNNLSKKISIIDYGTSNLASIVRSFTKVNARIEIISSSKSIENASRLILPGVGSFGNGMNKLKKLDLIYAINKFVKKGNPILGICLGMQMFLESSEENLQTEGLGFMSGKVIKISNDVKIGTARKTPHIGWSNLLFNSGKNISENKIFFDIDEKDFFYFVHSYMSNPDNPKNIIAQCDYKNLLITAAIKYNNILGLQFHPEISGKSGLKVIHNFIEYY